jgi:4-hydroxy-tetrahydrodipicolinate synthase
MAIPPVTVAILDDELISYFRGLLVATSLPLVVQDASGYVGRPMSVELLVRLLNVYGPERVLFKPEATPLGPRLSQLLTSSGGCARVFEGSGGIALLDSFRRGVIGTMPGSDLIDGIVALWRALKAGHNDRAHRVSEALTSLVSLQSGLDGFLAVEKHLLVRQGVFVSDRVRGPVSFRLDPETRIAVDERFDRLAAAVASPD